MTPIFSILARLLRGDPRTSIDVSALPHPLAAIARETLDLSGDPILEQSATLQRANPARISAFVHAAEDHDLSRRQMDLLLAPAFAYFDTAVPAADPAAELQLVQSILSPQPDTTPPLPEYALLDESLGADACPWLDRYIAFSRAWSPRAFDAFHEACGLWLLSTVAARRVTLQLGHPRYTNLYLALVARSSIYTKSTAAELAIATLQAAGLDWLLAPDDSTPQRFIYDLAAAARPLPDAAPLDEASRQRRAFAAQRGWYYEEFGQHLEAMVRERGGMGQFRSILKRFDDGRERYEVATLSRGTDLVERPYLALLVCMTPADLRPLARLGAALWHDGYLARFAFVTPGDGNRSRAPFPSGVRVIPPQILDPLRAWHAQLSMPTFSSQLHMPSDLSSAPVDFTNPPASFAAPTDPSNAAAGLVAPPDRSYTPADILRGAFPSSQPNTAAAPIQECVAAPDVIDAFYNYHNALLELSADAESPDLDAGYARHAEKALRVAMLLASLENGGRIELRHWARAQSIAERWRAGLHALVAQLNEPAPSHKRLLEQRVIEVVKRKGSPTAPEVTNYVRNLSTAEAQRMLDGLVKVGVLQAELTYKGAVRYSVK